MTPERPVVDVGSTAAIEFTVTDELIDRFAALSGDDNRLHMDDAVAQQLGFPRRVAHGCLTLSFVSTLIGTKLPGHGALWNSLENQWTRPVFSGDVVRITGTVVQRAQAGDALSLEVRATNQHGATVLRAKASVLISPDSSAAATRPLPEKLPARTVSSARSRAEPARHASPRAVLVTGGSRGIGREVALELARRGFAIAVGYNENEHAAATVVSEIKAAGGRAEPSRMTFGADSAERLSEVRRALGALVGLVHTATPPLDHTSVTELSLETLEGFWRVYVAGALQLCQALYPDMAAVRWGRIVFLGTSSLIGPPPPKMAAYVSAKSALLGLARSLAVELAPFGITTNVVSPGLTITDLTRDVSPRMQLAEAQRNPLRRLGTAVDTARAVAFLFDDGAAYINGAHLPVTGGAAVL